MRNWLRYNRIKLARYLYFRGYGIQNNIIDYHIIVRVEKDIRIAPHVAPDMSSDDDWEELLILYKQIDCCCWEDAQEPANQ